MSAGGDARDSSNATLALIIAYVRGHGGEDAVRRVLEAAGETRDISALVDESSWSSQQQKVNLFRAAAEVLGDPDVARSIGEAALDYKAGMGLRTVLRTVGSPAAVYRMVARATPKLSTNFSCEAVSVGRTDAVVHNWIHPGYEPNRYDCEYTAGLLSVVPALFGLPLASVAHDECQVRGAPACVYRLRWRERAVLPWRRAKMRIQLLEEEKRVLESRYEALQSTMVDLASPADVAVVLGRITRRAADAVQAQKFLLAVFGDDGIPAVHFDGMTENEALELARDIADPDASGPDTGSRIVVEVASARQTYGRLAAVYAEGYVFFPEERRLLMSYARQAAVALDAATALEEARERGETAQALLDLSRALAQAVSTTDVAERLADAVPHVFGGQHSAVMLVDPVTGGLAVVARAGTDVPTLDLTVKSEDTPLLGIFRESKQPIRLGPETDDPFIRELLAATGVEESIVVPIVGPHGLIGAITTSRRPGTPPFIEKRVLGGRLSGLADQASLALEKVRLIEQERATSAELRRNEHRIRHLAYHDVVTDLPNTRKFMESLGAAVDSASINDQRLAVLFCDLDRFKVVNDSLGHARGDELLRLAAGRLNTCVRSGDLIARMGGDEFTILLTPLVSEEEPLAIAHRVLAALRTPFVIDGEELLVSASVGVALYPEDGTDPQTLVDHADAAMYRSKRAGRDTLVRYHRSMSRAGGAR